MSHTHHTSHSLPFSWDNNYLMGCILFLAPTFHWLKGSLCFCWQLSILPCVLEKRDWEEQRWSEVSRICWATVMVRNKLKLKTSISFLFLEGSSTDLIFKWMLGTLMNIYLQSFKNLENFITLNSLPTTIIIKQCCTFTWHCCPITSANFVQWPSFLQVLCSSVIEHLD